MDALIIEDETAAAVNLKALLAEVDPTVRVIGVIDAVVDAVRWFGAHPLPDLVFMDIHLADGDAFRIFSEVDVACPVVFATAYDRYALDAFKVNGLDYLLKPIKPDELRRALEKCKRFSVPEKAEYMERTNRFASGYSRCFLVPYRDKLVPLNVEEIAYCYTSAEKVTVRTCDGRSLPMDKSLDTLMGMLPERDFFRANRQFIVSRNAVRDMSVWFGYRLCINLTVETPERIIVSKARVPEFKKWFVYDA